MRVVRAIKNNSGDPEQWLGQKSTGPKRCAISREFTSLRRVAFSCAHQAMLNGKVEKLEATVAQQQKQMETLIAQLREQADTFTAELKEQTAQIQKVSAQLGASNPAPQVVNNP